MDSDSNRSSAPLPRRILGFYAEGFRSMTIGRKLWAIILIKLAVIFLVLKLFFFPDFLSSKSDSEAGKAEVVREALTGTGNSGH